METGINNKCKAFTSLEQSKKLAEILPKETADFHFKYYSVLDCWCDIPHYRTASHIKDLPCWSLVALLNVLPRIDIEKEIWSSENYDYRVKAYIGDGYVGDWYDNPIDACVEMIITLKEREKQANNANKAEPKFKVGDWVVENEPNNYARFIQILEIVNVQGKDRYRISRDIHNDEDIVDFDFVEKYYHKFDIKDAKDGDVLCLGGVIAIFKKYIGQEKCICYCSFCDNGGFEIPIENGEDNVYGCTNTTPATQEERDLLFAKIHEAGYEWDAENRELKSYKLWK